MQRNSHLLILLCTVVVCCVSAIEPVTMVALCRAVTAAGLKGSEAAGFGVPLGGLSRVCYRKGVTVAPKSWDCLLSIKVRATRMHLAKLIAAGLLLETLVTWFFLAEEQGVWVPLLLCDVLQQTIF